MRRLWALAQLVRISNLPTIGSNVLVGLCAGYAGMRLGARSPEPESIHGMGDLELLTTQHFVFLEAALLLTLSAGSLYLAGMVLNDLLDQHTDAIERPQRPLPSGRVSRPAAWGLTALLLAIGLTALLPFCHAGWGPMAVGVAIVASIVAYNVLHRHTASSIWLMGLCRALVVVLAASIYPLDDLAWAVIVLPPAAALGGYTAGITRIARPPRKCLPRDRGALGDVDRSEPLALGASSDPTPDRPPAPPVPSPMSPAGLLIVIPPVVAAAWLWFWLGGPAWPLPAVAAALLAFWLTGAATLLRTRPPRTHQAVMTLLAGISLVDLGFLAVMDRPLIAAIAAGCFLLTVLGHRRIMGT